MRTKIFQCLSAAIFLAGATQTGLTLADHHVPTTYVVTSVTTMLLVGAGFVLSIRRQRP